jgi:hypothetical protein
MSIVITSRERLGELYLVTARATDRHGRTDESLGAVALGQLKGDALANALMKAETKAKRRVTLSLAGLGWLDETEIASIPGARLGDDAAPKSLPEGENDSETSRISRDEARALKRLAQQAYGYAAGERQLRQDLGLADEARLTLMRISAHTTATQYAALLARYEAALREAVEVDVPG